MDHHRKNRKQPSSSIKVERKIIEKNRRNHMKILFNNLFSLLPQHSTNPKEQGLTVADQIEETVEYIKSLDSKLKKSMEEKERLLMAIRNSRSTSFCKSSSSSPPKIEIGQVGSSLEIVLTSGLDYQFMFHEIICLIQQEGGEVLHANYSVLGNMIFHIVHAEISESKLGIGAAKIIREKLNKLVNGCMNDEEELWDIQIHNEMWGF
ncbi:transcription factor bHLH162-like [Carica papaya]|uniref:transcription factor bHLH162-like n=1 Tax=Carica papaya TaxID=3649 RepID=UPI000B8CBEEA|nr:transcription factor bHLH162-like [Carica papaya]